MKKIKQGVDKLSKIFRAAVKSFDEKTHTAVVMISTKGVDRDGEVIDPASFQKRIGNYLAHPVLLSSHRTDVLTRQIGEAKDIKITEEGVEGTYEWYVGKGNPEADWGWFLVTRGIAAFSVGFIPFEWVDSQPGSDDRSKGIWRKFTDIELLENSQVLVPANAQALQRRASEAQGEEKELCEMVVKSVKPEEMAAFEKKDEAGADDDFVKFVIDAVTEAFDKKIAELKEEILKLNATPEHYLNATPKHYSELLLGGGADEPIHTPTDAAKKNVRHEAPEISAEQIAGTVKTTIQEVLK